MIQQDADVLAPLAQRRHLDVDDVQAIVEILAERLVGNVIDQAAMRRGDHADVERRQPAIGPDALNLAGLEKAQQQRLHAQAHLADFVHEDRAAVGRSSQPRLSRCASVKLPLTWPNSSDSSSESGMPAQLIVTSGALRGCRARESGARRFPCRRRSRR